MAARPGLYSRRTRPEDIGGTAMKRAFVARLAWLVVISSALQAGAAAAQTTAGIRGKVIDEQGAGIPNVKIDMEFQGESRQKITKTQQTDKKGAFVRMGIPSG